MPERRPQGLAGGLQRKVIGAPVWVWLVAAVIVFFLWHRYMAGGTRAATTAQNSFGTGTNPTDLNGNAQSSGGASSGQGSAADNFNQDAFQTLLGQFGTVNSNLTSALLGATSTIEGLGTTALQQTGSIAQSSLDLARVTLGAPTYYVQPATVLTTQAEPSGAIAPPVAYVPGVTGPPAGFSPYMAAEPAAAQTKYAIDIARAKAPSPPPPPPPAPKPAPKAPPPKLAPAAKALGTGPHRYQLR